MFHELFVLWGIEMRKRYERRMKLDHYKGGGRDYSIQDTENVAVIDNEPNRYMK
jgi:hypothetical protein